VNKINDGLRVLKSNAKAGGGSTTSKSSKSSKKAASATTESDTQDALYGLSSSITLIKHLWRSIDCRSISEQVSYLLTKRIE
jgi:hypothetical protein